MVAATGPILYTPATQTVSFNQAAEDAHNQGLFWSLTGNTGTTSSDFLGTTDNQPLTIEVNGHQIIQYLPGVVPSVLGGASGNSVTNGAIGATIAGGGQGGGFFPNTVACDYGTVGGGIGNTAGAAGLTPDPTSWAAVAGGASNQATGLQSFVGGGASNIAGSGIGSPTQPQAASILGGFQNTATGNYSSIGGGQGNQANGDWSTVPGGSDDLANGQYSFAAGVDARADADGCFVWGDMTSAAGATICTTANQFLARASGGVEFLTSAGGTADVGVSVAAGGGSWATVSDRNAKKDFEPIDSEKVLEGVASMPTSTWRYETEVSGARHMGPMAQDFYAAYGIGDSDKTINTVDEDGVALAAIQGLTRRLQQKDEQLRAQDERIARLEAIAAEHGGGGPRLSFAWLGAGLFLGGVVLVERRRRDEEKP